ncbi:MAG: hypothetical protein KF850_00455 [Labilithrix sp.]|nr:hypothetical protein [Labilithrix sp.]
MDVLRHREDRHGERIGHGVRRRSQRLADLLGARLRLRDRIDVARMEVRARERDHAPDRDRDVVGDVAVRPHREIGDLVRGARLADADVDGTVDRLVREVARVQARVLHVDVAAHQIARLGEVPELERRPEAPAAIVERRDDVRARLDRRHRERRRRLDVGRGGRAEQLVGDGARLVREEDVTGHRDEVHGAGREAVRRRRVPAVEDEHDRVADDVTGARARRRAHVGHGPADHAARREEPLVVALVVDRHVAARGHREREQGQ